MMKPLEDVFAAGNRAAGIPDSQHDACGVSMRADPNPSAAAPVRFQHCRELIAILDPIFASRTLEEWAAALDGNGCYWGKVQSVEEVSDDPQALATEAFAPVELPDHADDDQG